MFDVVPQLGQMGTFDDVHNRQINKYCTMNLQDNISTVVVIVLMIRIQRLHTMILERTFM